MSSSTYTGTCIEELIARVDVVLAVHGTHERICKHCRLPYGDHTAALSMCPWPNPRQTRFHDLTCSASFGSGENPTPCERNAVLGSDFCFEHTEE